jgi:hypothetical protein
VPRPDALVNGDVVRQRVLQGVSRDISIADEQ